VRRPEEYSENSIFYRDNRPSGLLYLQVVRTVPRTRHYVSPGALTLGRPVLSFDYAREAYVLRGIGDRLGPVLREDRRRGRSSSNGYKGPERRGAGGGGQPHVHAAPATRSTPSGQGRSQPAGQGRGTTAGQGSGTTAGQARSKAPAGQTRSKASRRPRSKNARG
jgi:hypothetical protein